MAYGKTLLDRLVVELTADSDLKGIKDFDRAAEKLADTLDRVGRVAQGIGAAASAAVALAAAAFSGVEARLAEVAAKTGLSMETIRDQYFDALRDIQRETGRGDAELFEGLQKALSAGLSGEDAIDAVAESARAAAARIGTISDQVSAATTLMGQFEVTAGTALDVVARAAQVGEGETEDFANSLKGLGALGASVGFGLYDVAAGLAAISRSAKSVSEGETQFKAFVGALSGKSRVGAEILKEYSLSFEQLRKIGEDQGLAAVVATLQNAVGDDIEKLNRILGSSEALQFVLNTDVTVLENLTTDIERTAPGTIARAFAEGADLSVRKLEQLREGVRNVFEDIGKHIDPLAGWILDIGLRMTDAFTALPDVLKRATAYAGLLLAALLPLGTVVRVLAGLRTTTTLLSRSLARAAGEATAAGEGLAGTGKAAKGLRVRLAGLSRFLPLVLNPVGLIAAGIASLALIVAKWDQIRGAARSAWSAVKDFFSAERANREIAQGRLEAQNALVSTLGDQLALMREQGAAAGELAAKEAEIAEAKARQAEYDQRVRAGEALRELELVREVQLPGLEDRLAGIRSERAGVREQLDSGFSPGSLGLPLSGERQVTLRARLDELDTEEAAAAGEVETLRLQARVSLDAIAATNDENMVEAGAASYRAFGSGLEKAVPGLARDVEATLAAAFGPLLPSSDAARGPLSRLTQAGKATVEAIGEGIRSADPIAAVLAGALALPHAPNMPELEPLIQLVEQEIVPVQQRLDEFERLRAQALDAGGPAPSFLPVPPPRSYLEESRPGSQAAGPRSYHLQIDKIEINAPGADAREIAREIRHATRNEWRTLVEESDSPIDS